MGDLRRFDLNAPSVEYDDEDPPGFRAGRDRVGAAVGAQRTGASLYELPPGEALCPYHYEWGEEEWVLVVRGTATVRHPGGSEQLGPLQGVFFPIGPEGAHQVRNDTEETVHVLLLSEVSYPSVTTYPDSDKIGVHSATTAEDRLLVKRSDGVDYYEGEDGRPVR